MTSSTTTPSGLAGISRLLLVACPRTERKWIGALLSELSAIDGLVQRLRWSLGILSLTGGVIADRADLLLSMRLKVAATVTLLAAAVALSIFLVGFEALALDDDIFLALACAALTVFLVLLARAATAIYTTRESAHS